MAFWMISSPIRAVRLRRVLRGLVVALIFTPWFSDDTHTYLAPASIMATFEGLLDEQGNWLRAGMPVAATTLLCVIIALSLPAQKDASS